MKTRNLSDFALDLKTFDFDRKGRSLVADASDFKGSFRLHRLYDDAADVGIAVRSHRTDRVVLFVLQEEKRSGDDEIVAWYFVPLLQSPKDKLANVDRLVIFND